MIYMDFHRKHFHIVGLTVFSTNSCERSTAAIGIMKFLAYFLFLVPLTTWFACAFLYEHRTEIDHASTAIAIVVATVTCSADLSFFKLNEAKIGKLILDFQEMIDQG